MTDLAQTISTKLANKIAADNAAIGEFSFKLGPTKLPGQDAYVVAEVAYARGGNVLPYLTICGEVYAPGRSPGEPFITVGGRRYWLSSCDQCVEQIVAAFPKLAPFMRWHLAGPEGPMHYTAVYWAEKMVGVSEWSEWPAQTHDPDPRECFARTVVLGAAESSEHPDTMPLDPWDEIFDDCTAEDGRAHVQRVVTAWCEERRGRLLYAFQRDLTALRALGERS